MCERGPIPEGLNVLHRCDSPPCRNIDHLFLGTDADNMVDKVAKGRHPRGERYANAKLTEARVRNIRASSMQSRGLAAKYGVSENLISLVRHRKAWAHV